MLIDVARLARSDEWDSPEEETEAIQGIFAAIKKEQEAHARKEKEAAAKVLFDKEKEATAELLAELDAEEQTAAAAAAKKKSKKANKKKSAGGQRMVLAVVAASTAGTGLVVEECKAEDQELVPGRALQTEEGSQEQQEQQQPQEQQQSQRERGRGAPHEAAQEAALAAARAGLSLDRVETASTPTIAPASSSAVTTKEEGGDRKMPASAQPGKSVEEGEDSEEGLEDEKHDFFFDVAADGMKCSIGFCLIPRRCWPWTGFPTRKSRWRSILRIVQPRDSP